MAEHFITVLMSTVWAGGQGSVLVCFCGKVVGGGCKAVGNPTFICHCNQLLEGINRSLDDLQRKFSLITVLKLIREITQLWASRGGLSVEWDLPLSPPILPRVSSFPSIWNVKVNCVVSLRRFWLWTTIDYPFSVKDVKVTIMEFLGFFVLWKPCPFLSAPLWKDLWLSVLVIFSSMILL